MEYTVTVMTSAEVSANMGDVYATCCMLIGIVSPLIFSATILQVYCMYMY